MVDNFEKYKEYIVKKNTYSFDNDNDSYYVVELLGRGKDCPELPAANNHFRNYYINKVSDLDKYSDEIKKLCKTCRLRAYGCLCRKSYKQVMMDTNAEFARRIAEHDYKKPYSIYESCSGLYFDKNDKTWLIDIDDDEVEKLEIYKSVIKECAPYNGIIDIFKTNTGYHIITKPFDVEEYNKLAAKNGIKQNTRDDEIIKKNHLTLLFCDL